MEDKDKRIFTVDKEDGSKVKLSTRKPTNQEIEDAGMEYSREFTKAVRFGLMPREAMKAILAQNGTWTKKDDQELKDIEDQIVALETADYKNNEQKRKKALADAVTMREYLIDRRKVLASYLEHTAEAKAYEAQRDYIVCCVTEYAETGERVWPELNFKDEKSGEMVFRATYEHMTFINGVPSKIEEEKKTRKKKKDVKVEVSGEEVPVDVPTDEEESNSSSVSSSGSASSGESAE